MSFGKEEQDFQGVCWKELMTGILTGMELVSKYTVLRLSGRLLEPRMKSHTFMNG